MSSIQPIRVEERFAVTMDFASLLLAAAMSSICLAATMFAFWASARNDRHKASWGAGVLLVALHLLGYPAWAAYPNPILASSVFWLLPAGLAFLYGAAHQVFGERFSRSRAVLLPLAGIAGTVPFFLSGYGGVALVVHNLLAAFALCLCASVYIRHRADAPAMIGTIAALYLALAATFLICAAVLVVDRAWTLQGAPDNWAETLNVVAAIVAVTGIGALSIALDQSRSGRRHRRAAMTDPLTGVLNRRGLQDGLPFDVFGPYDALVIFDLDHFKSVNDVHGHATGDDVLVRFGRLLERDRRPGDLVARLGGEEFALMLPDLTGNQAMKITQGICDALAAESFSAKGESFSCTVSAGIAFGNRDRASLGDMLRRADGALYSAKAAGRNRFEVAPLQLAS